ncbi:MAG: Glu/Leu/Phe/Val dehydrogenase [Phycisphaerae bacterium]
MNLAQITKLINLPPTAIALLERPEKEITLAINIRVNENKLVQTTAYVCLYNTVRGPAKGGIRFHPHVDLLETRKLAELMVWKTALVGIPFGGGKTGVAIDPHDFTRTEKTIVMKELVHLIRHELMSGDYIPAPDMGTDAHDMATIFGETHIQECVTGKPPRVGGLPGREEATGRGVATVTKLLSGRCNLVPGKTTVAIQGFGNVGSWTAHFLHSMGYKVVAINDITGACYNPNGLNIPELKKSFTTNGNSLASAPNCNNIPRDEVLELPVDILIPAAAGGVITAKNAPKIKAKFIVEAANAPITDEAENILQGRKITIMPDILANAGGVIASYVEWRKARSGSLTPREETYSVIDTAIGGSFDEVVQIAEELKTTYRTAAEIKAVREVVATMYDRGWL